MAFLPGTRRAAKRHGNCELITGDVTGTLGAVSELDLDTGTIGAMPGPRDPAELSHLQPNLTLSVNILSQLPLMALYHLERRSNGRLKEDEPPLSDLCHDVVAHHLAWLDSLPGRVCLISDETRLFYRGQAAGTEEPIGEEDALFGNVLPDGGEPWIWDISPPGEQEKDIAIRHLVRGYPDF